jgi:hypothetical protein
METTMRKLLTFLIAYRVSSHSKETTCAKVLLAMACFALFGSAANAADLLYISEYTAPGISRGLVVQIPQEASLDQVTADFTSGQVQSNAFKSSTNIVRLVCTVQCSVLIGTNPTVTNANKLLPALVPEYFAIPPGQNFKVFVQKSVAPTCTPGTQATNFLARTSGLNATETYAYCVMINGLVSDGIITGTMNGANSGSGACGSTLDLLYIFATNNTTTAKLNLCGTSYSLTYHGTPAESAQFQADVGYTGDGSTVWLDSGFNPSTATTPNYAQNNASLAAYDRTSSTTPNTGSLLGYRNISQTYISPLNSTNTYSTEVNAAHFTTTATNTNRQGAWVTTRCSSTTLGVYKNGSSTQIGNAASDNSSALVSATFVILAEASSAVSPTPDQLSAAYVGACLTGTQAAAINNRINTYMAALGVSIY